MEGNFKASIKIVPEVLDGIEINKNFIDHHHIMLLYYKIACMYFTVDDYDNCIKYVSKIIKNKNIKMREDLQCFTRVLNLIAHWEAGIDFNLDKIIKDTYNYLDKMNDLHEVQKIILKYLNGLENIYPGEIKAFLRKGYNELKEYEQAAHWFKKAAERGFTRAVNNLGICYEFGYGVDRDWDLAIKLYQEGTEKGFIQSIYNLGYLYF